MIVKKIPPISTTRTITFKKESLYSDDKKFHLYQQNELSPLKKKV
jgi:hypothetical protein